MGDPADTREMAAAELAARAPLPATAGNIVTGTAGWTDPTLVKSGLFYARSVKTARQRLEFYARHFQMVEVDATYYSLVSRETTERWCEATPPEFIFHIKAHPVFTGHPIDVRRLPKDLKGEVEGQGKGGRVYADRLPGEIVLELERRFLASLEPLGLAGKLGHVLLQYPPWFTATRGNARLIEQTRSRHTELRFAVEFRHKSWLEAGRSERVFDMLRALEFTYVCVDEPSGPVGGLPSTARVTTPELAMVRFHGRNRVGWAQKGASVHERFNYLYSEQELAAWVEPARNLAANSERVHAVFNNCVSNYAVLNAKGLVVLLGVSAEPC